MQIHELPAGSPASGLQFAGDTGTQTQKIDYDALADAILNKLTTKTFNIKSESQTIIAALNALGDASKQDVANDLVTTAAGLVLDARQGKALDDKIASLNSRTTTEIHSLTLSSVQNCTVNACRAYTVGNVCALYLEVKINTNMTAGSEYVLGTLPSGYTPAGIGSIGSSGTTGTILGSGSVRIRPTISQSSGANLYLTATYVMP